MVVAVNAFNALNHVNFQDYVGTITSPFLGRANATEPARQLQLSVRFIFLRLAVTPATCTGAPSRTGPNIGPLTSSRFGLGDLIKLCVEIQPWWRRARVTGSLKFFSGQLLFSLPRKLSAGEHILKQGRDHESSGRGFVWVASCSRNCEFWMRWICRSNN